MIVLLIQSSFRVNVNTKQLISNRADVEKFHEL